MPTAPCYTREGVRSERRVELPEAVFGAPINEKAVHAALLAYQINQSKAQAKVLSRAQVSGGGRKPWRQKGTGHARAGSRTAPHWRGGGIVHGPVGRRPRRKMPKRLKLTAIRSALSARAAEERVLVIESLAMEQPKTSFMAGVFGKLEINAQRVLVVLSEAKLETFKSLRNLPGVEIRVAPSFCVYDVASTDFLLLEESALAVLDAQYGAAWQRSATAEEAEE